MHAKMTRDRKKSFIAAIEKTIEELESSNKRMNAVLAQVISSQKLSVNNNILVSSSFEEKKIVNNNLQIRPLLGVTPISSPAMIPNETLGNSVSALLPTFPVSLSKKSTIHTVVESMEQACENNHDLAIINELQLPPKKRVCHGFSLPY